jgi:hypothetical protein
MTCPYILSYYYVNTIIVIILLFYVVYIITTLLLLFSVSLLRHSTHYDRTMHAVDRRIGTEQLVLRRASKSLVEQLGFTVDLIGKSR